MPHISRLVVAGIFLLSSAVLVSLSPSVQAQPPGFGKGKGFDKGGKGFDKAKDFERPVEKKSSSSDDAVKNLENDLAKLKALEADILSQLKKLKEPAAAPKTPPVAGGDRFWPGERGPGKFPGGFGPNFDGPIGPGFGRGEAWGGFRPGAREGFGGPGLVQGIARTLSSLSGDQLKELIAELEKVRAEKTRTPAPAPRAKDRPDTRPGASTSNEEILKRLDRLTREIDELRQSLRKEPPRGRDR